MSCFYDFFSVDKLKEMLENIKSNILLIISAIIFMGLGFRLKRTFFISLILSIIVLLFISSKKKCWCKIGKQSPKGIRIYSLITACGVSWYNTEHFYFKIIYTSKARILQRNMIAFDEIFILICIGLGVLAAYFLNFYLNCFWNVVFKQIDILEPYRNLTKLEKKIYMIICLVSISVVIYFFIRSNAFYWSESKQVNYDIIYTSDSPALMKDNVYLQLNHIQNDLRQPLFMLFSSPFIGAFYLITQIFHMSPCIEAIVLVFPQIILLIYANLLIAYMMKLNSIKRICFMILLLCSYTYLLSFIMIEQYIFAYFWLIFCIYQFNEKGMVKKFSIIGAGGTLLTSLILLPFIFKKENIKNRIKNMMRYSLAFIIIIFLFCRGDIFIDFFEKVRELSKYTGYRVGVKEKILQFFEFIHNCFIQPNAVIKREVQADVSYFAWHLDVPTSINILGITILFLVILSLIINYKRIISRIAGLWVFFSVFMLLILGWGTEENGLILYSLYFAWAYIVLLFQLFEYIEFKLNIKLIVPLLSIILVLILLSFNIPAMMELLNFSVKYWPIS